MIFHEPWQVVPIQEDKDELLRHNVAQTYALGRTHARWRVLEAAIKKRGLETMPIAGTTFAEFIEDAYTDIMP